MRPICTVLAALVVLLVSAGYAAAAEPSGGPASQALSQGLGQAAASGQAAGALSGASQTQPGNGNISVRVLSPGDNGDVRQSNSVSSSSTAANANGTSQSADQSGSSCGCAGTQAIDQQASNDQAAHALSLAGQTGASNGNVSVRVASPGDNGSVRQANSVDSGATAANLNGTHQDADQDGGSGLQAIGQEAKNDQSAGAASSANQVGASNGNISVRVLSPGDDGHVSQSNSVDSDATAANLNGTKQDADQDAGKSGCGCPGGVQAIGQEANSDQSAGALSTAGQLGASNSNTSVRVASPGNNGSVRQSNSVDSDATAANLNGTHQDADQDGGSGTQAVGQIARSDQTAIARSDAFQIGASNSNTPVRVASPGHDGHVSQSNSVESDATAANLNLTSQDADQDGHGASCGCHDGDGIQAIGQEAKSNQSALAGSLAVQRAGCGCASGGNSNAPVRVGSRGGGSSIHQSNSVDSDATAINANTTRQDADQHAGGASCGCHGGDGIQAIGQEARSRQTAIGLSAAIQAGASNVNAPSRSAARATTRRSTTAAVDAA